MLIALVQGGTKAGWKKRQPQNKSDWECPKCHARCKFYWRNCPNCGSKRED